MLATYTFRRLSPAELADLVQNETAALQYLDVLSLLDDMLCEFLPEPRHPRFSTLKELEEHLTDVQQRASLPPAIAQCVAENVTVARGLRHDADQLRRSNDTSGQQNIAIDRFIADAANQYEVIRREY